MARVKSFNWFGYVLMNYVIVVLVTHVFGTCISEL